MDECDDVVMTPSWETLRTSPRFENWMTFKML